MNAIIDDKALALGEAPGGYRIDVDPRSRMFDANSPDCPPRPPDDPVSHKLMECVDGKPGAPVWNKMATTTRVDNPTWKDYLPRDKDGNVVLDLTGAVQVALLESPNYQQQLETLYLSGLDVTFERFRFDSQFFGGSSIFYTAEGPVRAGRPSGSSELVVSPSDPTNRFRVEKLTATGGELVVGLANSLVWQFAGPDNYTSTTLLDFSLVQPLLRAGGRARVLERLTIAERGLLSNVRQMEHYRRGFYLNVVTGRDPGQGPSRRGGVFGGSGLEGFSGVGVGGFGRVGGAGGAQLVQGFGFTGGAGAQAAGGYIGLLQTAQVIRNQFANIAALGDSLEQLQAANDAGRIDRFQVDLARQALYNAQSQLLNSQNIYDDGLDNFKLQYGTAAVAGHQDCRSDAGSFQLARSRAFGAADSRDRGAERAARRCARGCQRRCDRSRRSAGRTIIPSLVKRSARVAGGCGEADWRWPRRISSGSMRPCRRGGRRWCGWAARADAKKAEMDPELVNVERLDARATSIKQEYAALAQIITSVFAQLDDLTGPMQMPSGEHRAKLTKTLNALSGNLLELSLLQARARLDTITFEPVDLTSRRSILHCQPVSARLDECPGVGRRFVAADSVQCE